MNVEEVTDEIEDDDKTALDVWVSENYDNIYQICNELT